MYPFINQKQKKYAYTGKSNCFEKKISILNEKTANSFLLATASKKEFEQLKKSVQKDLGGLSEMDETESLRLQMPMDRTPSGLFKKIYRY